MTSWTIIPVFCVLIFSSLKAQDTISIIGSGTLQVKIWDVSEAEVKYKLCKEPEGPLYSIVKSAVLSINYENGTREDLDQPEMVEDTISVDWVKMAKHDANLNYSGKHSGAFIVGCVTAVLTPFLGWIPALTLSAFPPSESHLNISDYKLRRNKIYYKSYVREAHKIKMDRILTCYAEVSMYWFLLSPRQLR